MTFTPGAAAIAAFGLACAMAMPLAAVAQEAVIRQNFAERFPEWPPIDEVRKLAVAGLYEVRIGHKIFYVDEDASHLIEGELVDTKTRTSLTEARLAKLTAIEFGSLPLKDAIVWKEGKGTRRIAVFADPNCGACRVFERDLQKVKDVTVYTFLMPILGPDSVAKSRDIWCSRDRSKAWLDWMLSNTPAMRAMGECDTSVLQRNAAIGARHRINGTPAILFEDGTRVPGAMNAQQLEKQLVAAARAKDAKR